MRISIRVSGKCIIGVKSQSPSFTQYGQFSYKNVQEAVTQVLQECDDKGKFGGEQGVGEAEKTFYVEVYAPKSVSLVSGKGDGNATKGVDLSVLTGGLETA